MSTNVEPVSPAAIPPSERTDDPELKWLREVYQKDARQLTARAVATGMLLGMVMCLSNLYVVLKTGWSMGVTITSCILAYAVFTAFKKAGLIKTPFSMLENNAMGSVASAAGFMTGGGNMAAVPALLILTGERIPTIPLIAWLTAIAVLGVFAAIPIKRQLVNIEALPFPTGTATAETIRNLHHAGEDNPRARVLFGTAAIAGLMTWLREARGALVPFNIPEKLHLPFSYAGHPASSWTLSLSTSVTLVGAGALMSWKVGWSLLLGAVFTYGFLAPTMVAAGVIKAVEYKAIAGWMVWPGASMLVASGVLSFAFQWRSVAKSFKELASLVKPQKGPKSDDPLAAVECPAWWFPAGFLVVGPIVVIMMNQMFGIPIWAGLIALPMSIVMGVVAARVTGETDVTPTKALGPVTQVAYGVMVPGNVPANIMSANVTGGVGLHAADLLTDLKSGYLLGANPRQQFIAQMFGVLAGAMVVVPAFNMLIPAPSTLGTEDWPAPSVMVWARVSEVMAKGLENLDETARVAALIGALLGVAMVLAEKYAPKSLRPFIPSPSGVGIAMVVPGSNALAMFLGAALAEIARRTKPKAAEDYNSIVSSGLIAGESLVGIGISMLKVMGVMPK